MKPILCQNCKGRKNECEDYEGCYTCGGYGVVYDVCKCPSCGNEYYSKPGAHTIYSGKVFGSMDGVKVTYGKNGGVSHCSKCKVKGE